MARENAAAKARRLLVEGRVVVTEAHGRNVVASVRGDTGTFYDVIHEAGAWTCPCDAVSACSHVRAVQLVTAPVRFGRPA